MKMSFICIRIKSHFHINDFSPSLALKHNFGDMAYFEGLNGVNRQKSNGQKFNRELSKKLTFYHQPSKMQINTNCQNVSTVGTSNLTFSADPNRTPSS